MIFLNKELKKLEFLIQENPILNQFFIKNNFSSRKFECSFHPSQCKKKHKINDDY